MLKKYIELNYFNIPVIIKCNKNIAKITNTEEKLQQRDLEQIKLFEQELTNILQ